MSHTGEHPKVDSHVLMLTSFQEPSNKRVKPVAKSNSLTGVITPVKTPALKRIGQSISVTIHTHTSYRTKSTADDFLH